MPSWWYGPSHGWGTTYSDLDEGVAVFPDRDRLIEAARTVYGQDWPASLVAERTTDAELASFKKWISWWERFCADAGVKPTNRLADATIAARFERRTGHIERTADVGLWRARYRYALERQG